MPTYYTCSIIATSSEGSENINTKLTTSTNSVPNIPDRTVTKISSSLNDYPRIGTYLLTADEISDLRRDSGIKFVERTFKLDESEGTNIISLGTSSIISGSGSYDDFIYINLDEIESIQEGTFAAETNLNNLNENNSTFQLAYHTDFNYNNLYLGDGGSQTITKYHNSANAPTNFNYPLDGTGVDFINCEPVAHFHHEFFDKNGNSRVQYIDWYETIGESSKSQPQFLYQNSSIGNSHGTMTTSLAVGLVNGFAKNATIYICPISIGDIFGDNDVGLYNFSLPEGFRIIKNFHEQKPIDPNTGYKRPTVINLSLAFKTTPNSSAWTYPDTLTNKNLRNLKNTASIDLTNISENDGIRFEYMGFNIVIVSSSINSTSIINENYKGIYQNYKVIKFNDKTNIHNTINNVIFENNLKTSECFISCSLSSDNNILGITSSFQDLNANNPDFGSKQKAVIYIYTGSFNPNNNYFPTTTGIIDNTGSLVDTLGDPLIWPSNHINSIVVNGVEQIIDGSNNNFLNTSHYCPWTFSNKDYWGNNLSSSGFPYYGASFNDGITNSSTLNNPKFDVYSPTMDEIFEDLANSGVIICKSAGNRNTYISQTGSIDNPFFDPSRCDNILANNYFQKDVDTGTLFEANTPIYYNRAQPSNGSAILVGNGPNKFTSDYGFAKDNGNIGFPILNVSSNSGPGVDVYSPGNHLIFASPKEYSQTRQFTTNHNILSNINFDTGSVLNTIENNFSSLWAQTNIFYRTSSTAYVSAFSGGSSASSPIVAGIICCYVQAHPWANVKDIRNWIKSINTTTIPTFSDIHTSPLLEQRIYSTDITGSRFNLAVSESQTMQLGTDNSKIMYFPFNKPNPIEISGSLKMTGVNFSL